MTATELSLRVAVSAPNMEEWPLVPTRVISYDEKDSTCTVDESGKVDGIMKSSPFR